MPKGLLTIMAILMLAWIVPLMCWQTVERTTRNALRMSRSVVIKRAYADE